MKFRSIESAVSFIDTELNEQLHEGKQLQSMNFNGELKFGASAVIWCDTTLAIAAGLLNKDYKIVNRHYSLQWLELRPLLKYLKERDGYIKLIK